MAKAIRVLHVFDHLGLGGAETMIMNLYRHLDPQKILVDFLVHTQEKAAYDDEVLRSGSNIHRIIKYNGLNHVSYKRAWHKLLVSHPHYDIVHSHLRSNASIFLPIIRSKGIQTIVHSHNTSTGRGLKSVFKRYLQKNLEQKTDYMIGCSEKASRWLFGEDALKSSRHIVLRNGIETTKYQFNEMFRDSLRKQYGISQNHVVFGSVARFQPQKNHSFMIDIFEAYVQSNPKSFLVLIGNGELKEAIKKDVQRRGLAEHIVFVDATTKAYEYYSMMDVFLMTSIHEGLPLTLIEAQTNALPILTSDVVDETVKITPIVHFCSLNDTLNQWVTLMDSLKDKRVTMRPQTIIDAGYDTSSTAKQLTQFYQYIMSQKSY